MSARQTKKISAQFSAELLQFENKAKQNGFDLIIGVDESGRGPLAGPVVAAAVALKTYNFTSPIRDSKKLSTLQRERAFHEIMANGICGVGIINEVVIDERNILQASFLAMTNAARSVLFKARHSKEVSPTKPILLIDGNRFKSDLECRFETIVSGDKRCLSIACASIVAKVTRDRILKMYSRIFPAYGFAQHKGYPTQQHLVALKEYGPSLIHRKTFKYVRCE